MSRKRPETVNGWEIVRHGHVENYRKRLANNVSVIAIWENEPGTGTVSAHVEPLHSGRTLTSSRKDFRDKEAFWTAARCVAEMAANLPSLHLGDESPAGSALFEDVAGYAEVEPGTSGDLEAEITFTLANGRSVTLVMSEDQTDDLISRIHRLEKYVWSEQRGDEEEREDVLDDEPEHVDVPDVSDVRSGPDTGHDLVVLLESQFGVPQDYLMSHVDWSALIVVGEDAVNLLVSRFDELTGALAPRWYPVVLDRPAERWVVLRRTGLDYGDG